MPSLSGNNQVSVLVKTTADNSGTTSAAGGLKQIDSAAASATMSTGKMTQAVALGEAAYKGLEKGIQATVGFLNSSIESANKYQSAVIGLSSVSAKFGQNSKDADQAAQDLASDGLMSVTDAAKGLKNLLASGFSLPEAIQLMKAFKDSAAFNRQAALGFGDAVASATEGIKNGNSILVDNAGITKNLSVILEQAGKSQQDVMNISSDASVRQAAYNGILREASVFQGDAARASEVFAGSQARAAQQTEQLQRTTGSLLQAGLQPLLDAYTNFMASNQGMVISLGAGAGAAVAAAGAVWLVVSAIRAFSMASLIAAATNPLVLAMTAIAAVAGVVVYKAVDKMQGKVAEANQSLTDTGKTAGNVLPAGLNKAGKAAEDLAEKLADIDKQIAKTNRNFQEQMAETVKSHQDKVNDLKKQLDEESQSFQKSSDRDKEEFEQSQQDQLDAHQKKVKKIQDQIAVLKATSETANKSQVRDLQRQLDEENSEYDKQTRKRQQDYAQQVADAKDAHTKKTTDLQAQLDEENTLLTKHAADVAAVRNVTMLDEIDKIKRSHDEQVAALEDQKQKAIKSSGEAAAGVVGNWNNAMGQLNNSGMFANTGSQIGKAMGEAFKQALIETIVDTGRKIAATLVAISRTMSVEGIISLIKNKGNISKTIDEQWKSAADLVGGGDKLIYGRAKGGPVSAGQPYAVGDNPDGSWNDTTEVFVPNQSGTIVPAGQARQMVGGTSMYNTFHVYNQVDYKKGLLELGFKVSHA